MERMRIAGLCLWLLALCACDQRPVADEDAASGDDAIAESLKQPLERARGVEDLNLGRTTQLDEAVEDDTE